MKKEEIKKNEIPKSGIDSIFQQTDFYTKLKRKETNTQTNKMYKQNNLNIINKIMFNRKERKISKELL